MGLPMLCCNFTCFQYLLAIVCSLDHLNFVKVDTFFLTKDLESNTNQKALSNHRSESAF